MTSETKYLIEFSDIIALEFECKNKDHKCHAKISFPLSDSKRLFECPVCGAEWLDQNTSEEKSVDQAIRALRQVADTLKGRQFTIRLQIAEPIKPQSISGT